MFMQFISGEKVEHGFGYYNLIITDFTILLVQNLMLVPNILNVYFLKEMDQILCGCFIIIFKLELLLFVLFCFTLERPGCRNAD